MPSTSNSSSSSSDQEINKKDEGSLISSVDLHHCEEENRSPDLELLYVHLGTDSEDEDEEGLREEEEEDASDNDKKTQNAHVENLDKQKGDERTVDLEEGNNNKEEDEEDEDYSDSEDFQDDSSGDSMSSAEAREAAIRDGFLGFLYGYIQNDLFQKFLEKVANILDWILRKCGKNQDNNTEDIAPEDAVDEMAQEIMDNGMDDLVGSSARSLTNGSQTAGTGGSGGGGSGSGGGGGGGPVGPPPGVAEMATAAGNSATSAAASGAAAGVGATTAGTVGGLAGAATAVAGASASAQAGVAAAVAAVTAAAAVSTGVVPMLVTSSSNTTTEFAPTFSPPICSDASVEKIGLVEFTLLGMPQEALTDKKQLLEELFRDIYNEISGMCLDPMARVLYEANLQDWETDWGNNSQLIGLNTTTKEEYDRAVAQSVTTTYWEATVGCNGCPDYEPLFQSDTQDLKQEQQQRRQVIETKRNLLQMDISAFFPLFTVSFVYNLEPALAGDGTGTAPIQVEIVRNISESPIKVLFAATRSATDADEGGGTVMQLEPEKIIEVYEEIKKSDGIITAPFVQTGLNEIEDCLDQNSDTAQTDFCEDALTSVGDVDKETLSHCLNKPTDRECQEILPSILAMNPEAAGQDHYLNKDSPENDSQEGQESEAQEETKADPEEPFQPESEAQVIEEYETDYIDGVTEQAERDNDSQQGHESEVQEQTKAEESFQPGPEASVAEEDGADTSDEIADQAETDSPPSDNAGVSDGRDSDGSTTEQVLEDSPYSEESGESHNDGPATEQQVVEDSTPSDGTEGSNQPPESSNQSTEQVEEVLPYGDVSEGLPPSDGPGTSSDPILDVFQEMSEPGKPSNIDTSTEQEEETQVNQGSPRPGSASFQPGGDSPGSSNSSPGADAVQPTLCPSSTAPSTAPSSQRPRVPSQVPITSAVAPPSTSSPENPLPTPSKAAAESTSLLENPSFAPATATAGIPVAGNYSQPTSFAGNALLAQSITSAGPPTAGNNSESTLWPENPLFTPSKASADSPTAGNHSQPGSSPGTLSLSPSRAPDDFPKVAISLPGQQSESPTTILPVQTQGTSSNISAIPGLSNPSVGQEPISGNGASDAEPAFMPTAFAAGPTPDPTSEPTPKASRQPTPNPSLRPTHKPSRQPTPQPSRQPTLQPHGGSALVTQIFFSSGCLTTADPNLGVYPVTPLCHNCFMPSSVPSVPPSLSPSDVPSSSPSDVPSQTPSTSPSQARALVEFCDASDVGHIICVAENKLIYSTDNGGTWQTIGGNAGQIAVPTRIAISGDGNHIVAVFSGASPYYYLNDGSRSWSLSDWNNMQDAIEDVAIDYTGTWFWFAATDGRLLRKGLGEISGAYTNINNVVPGTQNAIRVGVNGDSTQLYHITSDYRVWWTNDHHGGWSQFDGGLDNYRFKEISISTNSRVWGIGTDLASIFTASGYGAALVTVAGGAVNVGAWSGDGVVCTNGAANGKYLYRKACFEVHCAWEQLYPTIS